MGQSCASAYVALGLFILMTDEERKFYSEALEAMWNSTGGKLLRSHIEEEMRQGWEDFIDLPVDKKTSKAAYDAQAKYKVGKGIIEWVESELRIGK